MEASSASGAVEIEGANNDVKVHLISGSINVSGNPTGNRLWDLKTVSGSVGINVPRNASFLLSAESTSGGIRTDIPVIIEEQSKHSLRAHVGDSSGRVEVHTVSRVESMCEAGLSRCEDDATCEAPFHRTSAIR